MKVKNLKGTSENFPAPTCKCNSWIEHWDNNKYPNESKVAGWCRGCGVKIPHEELIGGHVYNINDPSGPRYIIPLCNSCNHDFDAIFDVNELDLVGANCFECINNKTL